MPVGPPDGLGGGSVAQYQPAQKGDQRAPWCSLSCEQHRSIISRTGGQEIVGGEGLRPDAMEEMNPLLRMRWGPATELPWYFVNRIVCHIRPNNEAFVGDCG
jgi:hypothetical protein